MCDHVLTLLCRVGGPDYDPGSPRRRVVERGLIDEEETTIQAAVPGRHGDLPKPTTTARALAGLAGRSSGTGTAGPTR